MVGGDSYSVDSLCFDVNEIYMIFVGGKITYDSDGSSHGFFYGVLG